MNAALIHTIAAFSMWATALAAPADGREPEISAIESERLDAPLTREEVDAAQQAWCDGLLAISAAKANGRDYQAVAMEMLSKIYDFDHGSVLFKPMLAVDPQPFRIDKEGTAAYFIGGNPRYPLDIGFALKPWVKCTFTNVGDKAGMLIEDDFAATTGSLHLTDSSGKATIVDKLFAFRRSADGRPRIVIHASTPPRGRSEQPESVR